MTKYLFILLLVSMPASATTICTDLGGGFTQCYDTDPDPGDGQYSTCYELDGTTVCEDQ